MVQAPNGYTIFNSRAILSFWNETVMGFNDLLIEEIPGEIHTFHAVNPVDINEQLTEADPLSAEYLQSIHHASLPSSKLTLKIGAPVMLFWN